MPPQETEKYFSYLGTELSEAILTVSTIQEYEAGTELMREGQYVKVVPLVVYGLVKVFTRKEDKELLLYYIQPRESCIMSFTASIRNEKSKIFAITETATTIALIPSDKINQLVNLFPSLNQLFYQQFDLRYTSLIDTINALMYERLDKRLLDYLQEKLFITGKNPLVISHREIATDLGTAREVVSRLIKKLEHSNQLRQHSNSIEILSAGDPGHRLHM